MTKQYLPIGSLSSGTMREEDLIPAFLDALESVDPDRAKGIRENEDNARIFAWLNDPENVEYPEEASYLLNEDLFDALNEYCPPYFYFGANEGDGSDYGVWPTEDINQQVKDNGGLVVSDLEEIPADFVGEVLHVNDHGNATLFYRPEGSAVWSEVWSIV